MTGTDTAARPDRSVRTAGDTGGVPIEMDGLGRDFGPVRALVDVTMSVRPGEIVALLGPSGSGKSTLLRICAGLESASSGRLLFGGVDQAGIAPHRRDVSLVFQHYALYPHLSALDNLTLALRYGRGQPKKVAVARARETLEMLGIGALADRRPAQLSGGQRQRVALARALVNQPKVLLLDEPLGALDLKLRQQMQVELKAIQRDVGITFVFVTHDQEEALTMSDRIAVFNDGGVEQVGTSTEVYERPATPFVAGFVGTTNLVEGAAAAKLFGQPGIWSIRPERVRVATPGQVVVASQGTAEGVVREVVYLGSALRLMVDVGSGTTLIATEPTLATAQTDLDDWLGRSVRLVWEASHARNVDAA
jgi:ABC-type Fe3+/spermidine/putrescine transport system ATPase subunit